MPTTPPLQFNPAPETISMVQSLTPAEWGLPPKFSSWRPGQPSIVASAIDSPTHHHINCVPTGGGKSPAYTAHAVLSGSRTVVLTSSLGLQTQNMTDFESIGMADIRGRSNYKCLGYTYLNCDEGHPKCHVCREGGCPRELALKKAMVSELVVTSYPFWLANNKYGQGLGVVDLLILDEAHDAVDQLASFMSVQLTIDALTRSWKFITRITLGTEFEPKEFDLSVPDGDEIPAWAEWAKAALRPYSKFIDACSPSPDGSPPAIDLSHNEPTLRDFAITKRVHSGLVTIAQARPETWVCELTEYGAKFDPIWPSIYNHYLFKSKVGDVVVDIKKIVHYSATVRPKTAALLGITRDDYTFSEFPSGFDPRRSPIYFIPTVNLRHDSTDVDFMRTIDRVDQIIRPRLDRKGFIPTHSFPLQRMITGKSEYHRYMLYNSSAQARVLDGKTITKIIEEYRAADPPSILVTPSAATGYDFEGDDCRYLILPKVPFPDTRSKIMRRRKEADPEYYNYLTMLNLIQPLGRATRSPTDWCENFVVDNNYQWFMNRNRQHAPEWFQQRTLINGYVPRCDYMPRAPLMDQC